MNASDPARITVRHGDAADAHRVAELHALSWRTAYRDFVPAEALGDGLAEERGAIWELRLTADYGEPAATPELLIAEHDGETVGFAYLVPEPDGRVLLDNLHVHPHHTGAGIGHTLLTAARSHVTEHHPEAELYLEVLCANTRAIAFYEREGGHRTAHQQGVFPGGFTLPEYVYTWPPHS
ncbi:GNAT family N-acetyltransferase [Streptomyces sp. NRRL WC-3742]|uniref:GNAT family N-acetyltransferase n=1 Tax=Streptomyces sp. NRRL WC-3742 TaxID=1463934 RepID=UPI00099DCAC6|nr:GNAT family N-acetyltransferase [Streptomyces sp. NRRL WC-3742]